MRGRRCVVTGGFGFIGANIVHRLIGLGSTVKIVDALVPSHGGNVRNVEGLDVEHHVARIGDESVADVIADADVIFNLAGQVSHTASMADPVFDLEINAVDHSRFLEMVRRVNPGVRIVHASTRQVYGRVATLPAHELTAANPVDVNGVAKLAGEQLHMVYAHAHGIASTSLRLSNVYGPRQRLTSNELGFLPVFIRRALLGQTIEIFGDGSQQRDCLHVDDVVDALLAATADAAVGRIYNVGNRHAHSLAEIATLLVTAVDRDVPVEYVGWPDDHHRIDIGSFTTDSSRIANDLGWRSSIDIDVGLKQTIAFYEENPWYLSST